ncbi:hypothetical protein [Faecalibacter macacae]|uniref:Lipoprotein n=1 Tax=Faecalibacter macacae TaxID=1859289 RepID=A0A3L9M559_9FLAO|nr:hypothetical protein [Faecalibacter macacae]RLZ08337.1 hypothetical protein EAH69_10420 [Faecalibacter macacae]
MKKIGLLLVVTTTLLVSSCTKMHLNPYSNSTVIKHNAQGLVTLRGISDEVLDKRKTDGEEESLKNAHKKAIQQFLYMGFPGTDFKNGVIKKGASVETTHAAFFEKFWAGDYKRFITNSDVTYYNCKEKVKCISAVTEFTINYNALRKELEENKIINKIGF